MLMLFFSLIAHAQSICADGWVSSSSGRGTCSWHGGVAKNYVYIPEFTQPFRCPAVEYRCSFAPLPDYLPDTLTDLEKKQVLDREVLIQRFVVEKLNLPTLDLTSEESIASSTQKMLEVYKIRASEIADAELFFRVNLTATLWEDMYGNECPFKCSLHTFKFPPHVSYENEWVGILLKEF